MSSGTLTRQRLVSLDDLPDPELLSDAELAAEIEWLNEQLKLIDFDWPRHARPEQRLPESFTNWLLMGGRGAGKSRSASEAVREACKSKPLHVAVISRKGKELRDVCFEHRRSGLCTVIPKEEQAQYYSAVGDTRLVLTNGTIIRGFSAEVPDSIRGYEFDLIWCDEFAAWPKNVAQDMYDQAWFTLRESPNPRMILTTTPRRVPHMVKLATRAGLLKDSTQEPGFAVSAMHTMDNAKNLSPVALAELRARYEGTRLGRQELGGELLEDVEDALWPLELIEAARWEPPEDPDEPDVPALRQIITAVDPSGSENGDATGIVTIGITMSDVVFVLADDTTKGTPEHRYETACLAAHREGASMILYEGAYGGDNIAHGLRSAWGHLAGQGQVDGHRPQIVPSNIPGDKVRRAEPVVALYEQQARGTERIWHAVPLPLLEDEQTTWEVDSGWSPNRIDALVHGVRRLTRHMGVGTAVHSPTGERPLESNVDSRWSRRTT